MNRVIIIIIIIISCCFYPYVNFYVSYFTGVIKINYNFVFYAFHATYKLSGAPKSGFKKNGILTIIQVRNITVTVTLLCYANNNNNNNNNNNINTVNCCEGQTSLHNSDMTVGQPAQVKDKICCLTIADRRISLSLF